MSEFRRIQNIPAVTSTDWRVTARLSELQIMHRTHLAMLSIELPEMGASVDAGSEVAVIESVKGSDIYPVTGEVIEVNPALEDEPETVNSSPYADGWLFRVMPTDMGSMDDLMDADGYAASIEEHFCCGRFDRICARN